ncbi:TRAM domain-containing protein [uncultured Lactobacillus sp.]|nr:TRAM domain-containing protein [uncultured Lactobacillus sp.]
MREKDILDVTIDDLSPEGRGLAKYGNKLVFVGDALPGEEVHENTKKY